MTNETTHRDDRLTEHELAEDVRRVGRELGRWPRHKDYAETGEHSAHVVRERLGTYDRGPAGSRKTSWATVLETTYAHHHP